MTRDELEKLLEGKELPKTLDVKTLVLDLVRDMSEEEILQIFWGKLDDLSPEFIRDYFYMKR